MPDPTEDKTTIHRDMAREARRLSEVLMSYGESHIRADIVTIFHLLDRYAETLDVLMDKDPNLVLGTWGENSNC